MPATINESDIPAVVDLLSRFAALNPATIPSDLSADEVALISRHRRQRIVDALENKGIVIRAAPVVREPVLNADAMRGFLSPGGFEEFDPPKGWFRWNEGDPVPTGRVEYEMANGVRDSADAARLIWKRLDHPNDIAMYRQIRDTPPPEPL